MAYRDSGIDYELIARRATNAAGSLQDLARIVQDQPSHPGDRALAAGKVSEMINDFSGAVTWYERALGTGQQGLEACARLALVSIKRGEIDEGLRHARALVLENAKFTFKSLGGTPLSAYSVLGDAYAAAGQNELAVEAYNSALKLQPSDGYSAGRLAQAAFRAGDLDTARKLLEGADTVTHSRFDELAAALRSGSGPVIRGIANVAIIDVAA